MTEIVIFENASQLSEEQKKQVLKLHYTFLNYQRSVLNADHAIPTLRIEQLFAGNRICLAIHNGTPVAYFLFRVIGGVLKIRSVFVMEAFRRNGIMTGIINKVQQNSPHWKEYLTIHKNCKAAISLFKERGFHISDDGDWVEMSYFTTEDNAKSPVAITA